MFIIVDTKFVEDSVPEINALLIQQTPAELKVFSMGPKRGTRYLMPVCAVLGGTAEHLGQRWPTRTT